MVTSGRAALLLIGSAACCSIAGLARAQPISPGHGEFSRDPEAPAWPRRVSTPRTRLAWPADLPPSHQVNVDAQGLNIVGDAANEPSIAVDPTAPNRIAIGWRQFDSVASNFREAGRASSRDGGRTWTFPGVLDNGVFRSDPVLRAAADGRLYYYSLRNEPNYHCQMFISTDFGATYSAPIQAYGGDKEWIAVDRSGGPGHGNVYAAWDFASAFAPFRFTRSSDLGLTYITPLGIPGNPDWGTCDTGPDGQFYVIGKTNSGFTFARSTSPWLALPVFDLSGPVNLGGTNQFNIGTGPNPGGLLGQAWVVVDRSNGPRRGWVYALSSVKRTGATDPLDVMFARSANGGQTWTAPIEIDDEPAGANAYQWFGTIAVAPSGRLDVLYNDTRDGPGFQNSRLRYTRSNDGGDTWAPSEALTLSFNSLVGWPAQNKLGDYYDMESDDVGAFVAYAATFNSEQDVYFMRIGDYDCNRNGVGDTQDLLAGVLHDCNGNGIPDECEIAAGQVVNCPCYADCNADGSLTVADFGCFQTKFVGADPYADCNTDGSLTVADFGCFQTKFVAGCP